MEQAHKLFAPEYLELPQVLLEEQRHFIPKVEANALALQCGFKEDNWEYGLRVMEQVSFFLLFLYPLLPSSWKIQAQWMVTCRLPELASSFVVLHVQWLSDVLLVLLYPPEDIIQDEGVLVSQDGLRRVWHEKGIVEDTAVAEELLKVLPGLHVHLARQRPGQSDRCFFVPQRLPKVLPEGLSDAFEDCVAWPHAGLRARPLEEDGRRGKRGGQHQHRHLLDAFTFSQLQSFLACRKGVQLRVCAVTPSCCLVQPGGLPGSPCCMVAPTGTPWECLFWRTRSCLLTAGPLPWPLCELRLLHCRMARCGGPRCAR